MGTKDPPSDSAKGRDRSRANDPELDGHLSELLASFPSVEPDTSVWDGVVAEIETTEQNNTRRSPWQFMAVAAVAVLFLGLGAFLGSTLGADGTVVASDQVRELVDDQGHVVLTVSTADDGSTTATGHNLPALPASETYQLWSVVGGEIVSVGLLGQEPSAVSLRVEGSPEVLALSVEVAGGVAVSENPPVAVWSS
ncbi:MAG: anti-sigma factor domain-containing protein [Acidimicrobiia bacterium]